MSVLGRATPFLVGGVSVFQYTLNVAGSDRNLRSLIVAAGWDQLSPVAAEITANQTGATAVTITGSFPGGLQLTNSAVLYGGPGAPGGGGWSFTVGGVLSASHDGGDASSGGTGILIYSYTGAYLRIVNNGVIASGGGGGGGGNGSANNSADYSSYTGGQGGQGGTYYTSPNAGVGGQPFAGNGGDGGAYNTGSGADGTQDMTGVYWTLKGRGAACGYAVSGYAAAAWSGSGSIQGPTA